LTPDGGRRAERLLAAAHAELMRGVPDRASELLAEAEPRLRDPLRHAEALRLRGAISLELGRAVEATRELLAAARALEPLDARLARQTLLEAFEAATVAGRHAGRATLAAIAEAADAAIGRAETDSGLCDLLLAGFAARATGRYAEAAPPLRRAIEALRGAGPSDEERLRWLGVAWVAASDLLEVDAGDALARQWVALARRYGALTTLSQALGVLGVSEALAGNLEAADASFAERLELNAAIGVPGIVGRWSAHHLIVLAWRGRESEARAAAEAVMRDATERRQAYRSSVANFALSVLHVGLGQYDAARECALRVFANDPVPRGTWVLPELVEAAIRVGDHDAASAAVERLAEHARANPTPCARGLLARCRAQLDATDGVDVEALYLEAIETLQGDLLAPELARSHLLYGEWLRRRRRRIDARQQLRIAYEMLDHMGAEGFAERARTELLATGAKARKRTHETRDELTQHELHVARLAAEGASNAEIAAQLFISPSTVAYHLHKTFRKLNVSSRTQLARSLPHTELPQEVHDRFARTASSR
jgi:DNA-binding CsgD family transcriptional regulator